MGLDSLSSQNGDGGGGLSASVVTDFGTGLVTALKKPLDGIAQLTGHEVTLDPEKPDTMAESAGEMVGNAILFYAASTALKGVMLPGAPIAAGATIGFLDPVRNNDSKERLINAARGAATMFVMEKMPGYCANQGFRGDFFGNFLKVALTGATAGAVDVNLAPLLRSGQLAPLETTAEAAVAWAATGATFHYASLGLNKSFRAITENPKSTDLLLLAPKNGADTYPVRDFLNSVSPYGVRYRMMDISKAPGITEATTPIVMFPDGARINGTDIGALSKKLNLHTAPDHSHYRVAIVGAGPAGVQTAINAASELPHGQQVSVIAEVPGGQARYTSSVKNFMGFPDVTGSELMTRGLAGANARGAETILNRVASIDHVDGTNLLTLRDGTNITADSVVLATGQSYNQLDAPGIERLTNKGVYTLADAHEAPEMKGQKVILVGAGNSAGQAAINLSNYAREVHLLVRANDLNKTMSEYLINEIKARPNIQVHLSSEVAAADGVNRLETVDVATKGSDGTSGTTRMSADAMYVYIGGKPNTGFLKGSGVALDSKGFVLTGHQLEDAGLWHDSTRAPLPFETSVPGVFAAGDVNAANPQKRIVSAVGDAGKLIGSLHSYLPGVKVTESIPLSTALAPQTPQSRNLSERLSIKLPSLSSAILRQWDTNLATPSP